MYGQIQRRLQAQIKEIRDAGLYKAERLIDGPQGAWITLKDGRKVMNLCANNYLGLSGHPELIKAAGQALDRWGYGLSSVRFICGTQTIHKELEASVTSFLGTEDTILYSSCFDANGGLFEALLGDEDVIISDQLNHASIIDGIRLCKAKRLRYANANMVELEERLKEAQDARFRMIATDGVFSMDGVIAPLDRICDLADRYDALVMVDDSHAVGFVGPTGRGSHEHAGVMGRVDIITGTFGKALGGASGGYTSGRREVIEILRQCSRPYLFSNSLAPAVAATSLTAIRMIAANTELRDKLAARTKRFREAMTSAGFDIVPGEHPIVPIMLGDARRASGMAEKMLQEGIYVVGFSFPVVPKGGARIRVQMSAALDDSDIDLALGKFKKVGRDLCVI